MSLNPQQEQSLAAFVTALSQQDDALPDPVKAQLHALGQNLENRVVELPTIAASLPSLNSAYQKALAHPQASEDATLVSATNQDHSAELLEHATQIFTSSDPVQAAQKSHSRSLGAIASNPLKRLFRRG